MEQQTSYRTLLAIPGLLALIFATIMARLAGRMFSLTLILYVLARFSSPALAGWLRFAAIAPGLLISPLAGAFLDRAGPTKAVKIDLIASALLITAVSIAGWNGWANPPILFASVMLFSLTSPLGASGIRSLMPRLVPPAALDRANALDTAIYAVVDVLGPGLAGLAVAWLGPNPAMLLVAVTYAGAALCLLQVQRLPGLGCTQASLLRQTIEGMAIVARQSTLRGLAIA